LLISLDKTTQEVADNFVSETLKINGVEEVTLRFEEGVAYLKVDNQQLNRDQLQGIIEKYLNV